MGDGGESLVLDLSSGPGQEATQRWTQSWLGAKAGLSCCLPWGWSSSFGREGGTIGESMGAVGGGGKPWGMGRNLQP